jgi:DNA-binding beta-propeller fold protein YncE
MRNTLLVLALGFFVLATVLAQAPAAGPYSVVKTAKVGGDGGWDYVNADPDARRLYIARTARGNMRVTAYNLDTLEPAGTVPIMANGVHGVAIDPKSGHGIASSKPITMFDRKTQMAIKTIEVDGNPDGLLFDPFNGRFHVLSHQMPFDTVINAADGKVLGTIDLGGQPEQAASDGKGKIYVDLEDKSAIAVVDAKTMMVTAKYDITGSGGTCAGLALDAKNQILFAACRNPQNMVVVNAKDGKVLTTIPIGPGTDGAAFNPKTMEAFSSNGGDGTLTVVKENSPTSFTLEETVQTKAGARTMAMDPKTGQLYLVTAEFGPPPPPAPAAEKGRGARGGRGAQLPDSFTILVVGKK